MTRSDLEALVPEPGCQTDFMQCLATIPQLSELSTTPQDPIFHAEGDVWTHTIMVVNCLVNGEDYAGSSLRDRFTLFYAALLHDIAKPATTVIDPVTGKIGQPGHSRRGAIDARLMLWRAGVAFDQRETICRIIAVHQVPFFALKNDKADAAQGVDFTINKLSWELPIWMLCAIAKADIEGRHFDRKLQQMVLDDIAVFRLMAEEKGCLSTPAQFPDEYTRMRYFRGALIQPEFPFFREKTGSSVIVMSGMPASGKDTWVRANTGNLPVISFDDARDELGLTHGKNEGKVAHHAIDKAKALLRRSEPFVWNSTHLSSQMRKKTLDLLYSYDADVKMTYLEQPEQIILQRNSKRDTSLTNKDLVQMLFKWEVPTPVEAGSIEYLTESQAQAPKFIYGV